MADNKDSVAKADDVKSDEPKTAAEEYNYTLPTSQVGLQSLQSGAAADTPAGRSMQVAGNDTSGYLGVSPEYANYANEVDKPMRAGDGSPEQAVEDVVYAAVNPQPVEPDDEDAEDAESKDADEKSSDKAATEGDKCTTTNRAQVTSTTHQASRATAPRGKQQ